MTVTWSWDLQAKISGVWTSISEDVLIHSNPITASRGIDGRSITDRVAQPGTLSAALDNGESNSGAKLGYYSPDHANMRANFGRGTEVRLKLTYSGNDRYVWHGEITDLNPTPGRYAERKSFLTATDFMQKMMDHKLSLVPVQENQRSDQVFQTILSNMANSALATSIETDKFSLGYSLSSEQDERTTAMMAIQKLCQTVLAYCYIRGDATGGETLVFQREETRSMKSSSATLSDTMSELKTSRNTDDILNKLIGYIHPVRVDDAATTLLYELENDLPIDAGGSTTVTFKFRDPNNLASRVSAKDVVTPFVANTHYRMSAFQDGTGNDLTPSLTITPTVGANAVEAALSNAAGVRGYINLINIFGRGIYYYSPVEISVESGDADKVGTYDFYYLSDPYRAKSLLTALHYRTSTEITEAESVTFFADADSTLMGYAMTLDVGDRVTLVEAATGLNNEYTINKVTYTIEAKGRLRLEWVLEVADTHNYFILNSSVLNGTDVLSPY